MSWVHQWKAFNFVAATVVFVVGLVAGAGWKIAQYPDRPHKDYDHNPVVVIVARGMTPSSIARLLGEKDILKHPQWFRFYATERGDAGRIKPGRYTFNPAMTPRQIMDALIVGVPDEEVAVTIPEGKNILEIADLIDGAGITPKEDLVRAFRDPGLMRQLGVPGETFEGYLYPDRYQFRPGTSAAKVVTRLVKHGKEVYADVAAKNAQSLAQISKQYGFDSHQIVLMASLVEKETAKAEERPRIAGVFYNRLRLATFKPHLLQTDPTIAYGCTVPVDKSAACSEFEGRIHRVHLDDPDNPYNTYTHEGLPPGPISNPGRAALEAAMKPDSTPFLYFVSKNDGSHYFSKTVKEHELAVDKYQRGKADVVLPGKGN